MTDREGGPAAAGGPQEARLVLPRIALATWRWPSPGAELPGAPPVVLVHPNRTNARVFDFAVAAAGTDAAFLAYDLRGHGNSDWPQAGYGIDDHLADLLDLLSAVGREGAPVALAGQGTGALLALLAASVAPERVAAVFAAQPVTAIAPAVVERVRREVAAHRIVRADEAARAFTFAARWRPEVLAHAIATSLAPVPGGLAFRYHGPGVVETEEALAGDFLERIAPRCPVLLVRGGESEIVRPADLARIAGRLPAAETAELCGADHRLSQDDPEGFARLLDDFLVRHGLARRR